MKNYVEFNKENLINNPIGLISQRGGFSSPTATSNGTYHTDQWKTYQNGVTGTYQRVSTLQPDSLINSYSMKYAATSTGSGRIGGSQPLDNATFYREKTLTVSGWVKSNSSNAYLGVFDGYTQPSAQHSGGGSWEFLQATITVNVAATSVTSAVVLGSSSFGNVSLSSGDYIEFTGMKLEFGEIATPFVPRDAAEEDAICKRFLWVPVSSARTFFFRVYIDTNNLYFNCYYHHTMRATPSIIFGTEVTDWVIRTAQWGTTTGFSTGTSTLTDQHVILTFNKTSHGLSVNDVHCLSMEGKGFYVTAEL